jgi:hypothetical protein
MVLQLPQDLVHLEGGDHGLDQHRRADRAVRDAEFLLRQREDVVPQARLEVRFQLRQVEVGPGAAREQLLRVVEEEEREVEDAARDGLAVDRHVLLVQVPAARAREQHRGLLVQAVALAALLEGDGAAHGVTQVCLPLDHVLPRRAVGVLEIRLEGRRAAIERVDHHLAVGGSRDLDAPVADVGGLVGHLPVGVADRLRRQGEVGHRAAIELGLPGGARGEELLAARLELAAELCHEGECIRREDRGVLRCDTAGDLHSGGKYDFRIHGMPPGHQWLPAARGAPPAAIQKSRYWDFIIILKMV